ncbi:MAG TPA: plant virulence effector HPE1-like domain-containing protein [Pseudorhizobium sp.]|nr:plant virulence effector HPE1-like domain-containing protein [Pseudorhizobium sp.]
MRFLLTSAVILASGVAAHASSITPVISHGGNGSVVAKSCSDCPPLRPKDETSGYKVPVLKDGAQRTEIVEINGEKKVVRTEAWLGGSPVVHIRKVQDWMPASHSMLAGTAGDGLDHHALVGAVDAGSDEVQVAAEPAALDLESMQLRLK